MQENFLDLGENMPEKWLVFSLPRIESNKYGFNRVTLKLPCPENRQ